MPVNNCHIWTHESIADYKCTYPVFFIFYAPFVWVFGKKGLLVTNFLGFPSEGYFVDIESGRTILFKICYSFWLPWFPMRNILSFLFLPMGRVTLSFISFFPLCLGFWEVWIILKHSLKRLSSLGFIQFCKNVGFFLLTGQKFLVITSSNTLLDPHFSLSLPRIWWYAYWFFSLFLRLCLFFLVKIHPPFSDWAYLTVLYSSSLILLFFQTYTGACQEECLLLWLYYSDLKCSSFYSSHFFNKIVYIVICLKCACNWLLNYFYNRCFEILLDIFNIWFVSMFVDYHDK